jgi:muramoyltetrapeptide carboxypeptidase LdcA involved in peptidoglycan recycling
MIVRKTVQQIKSFVALNVSALYTLGKYNVYTNRYAKRTDEMLGDMVAKNVFSKAAAVVICDFNSKSPKKETSEKLAQFAAKIPCPVFAGFPYGHIPNTSVIDFRRALSIAPDGTLVWKK